MLRKVLQPTVVQRGLQRSFNAATSRQKRALNNKQIQGGAGAGESTKATTPPPAAPEAPAAIPLAGVEGGSGGISLVPVFAVVAAGGAGAAYYMDGLPDSLISMVVPATTPNDEQPKEPTTAAETKKDEASKEEDSSSSKVEATKEVAAAESSSKGNRVVKIALPNGSTRSAPAAVEAVQHPVGGHRVSMVPRSSSLENEPTADAALKELQAQISKDTDRALGEAHVELAKLASLDLHEIDDLTPTQLKIRLVQMAKDLQDRTKWEAVRLKEFLAMKEKEVEDKYVLLLKKQRLEAEVLMEQRLREQDYTLTNQADSALREKEVALQSIVDNSLKIQEQSYEDDKAGFEKRVEEAMNAKYEELFGKSLAQAKQEFAQRMEQKVNQMETLTKKLADLEFSLQSSKDFQSGSVQAHRTSAAALALIDKLESSKPAAAAVGALKAVAQNNPVVASALEALPSSVAVSGISTIQELQARFDEQVHAKCRQAANVPTGQQGLEGQLLGMAFATLKYAPGPEDPAPESDKDSSEYVLARARRHVQLGELEPAIEQMSKLQGQAAFTAKDWVTSAKERVAVEKALKVIRMECALANASMSNGPSGPQ